jgi:hypothetical protein
MLPPTIRDFQAVAVECPAEEVGSTTTTKDTKEVEEVLPSRLKCKPTLTSITKFL